MNPLLYLISFFLLSVAGVFGVDLPGLLLVDRESQRPATGSGYFVSVPDSVSIYATDLVSEASSVDLDRHKPRTVAPVPAPTPSSPSPPETPVAPPTPTPEVTEEEQPVTPLPPPSPPSPSTNTDGAFTVQAIVDATNRERMRAGLTPLRVDVGLNRMASQKVDNMIRYDYFDHVSPQGVDLKMLAEQAGYRYILIGENLAYGNFADPQAIVDAWMDSPGHRANILHTGYTHIGVGLRQARFRGIDAWVAVQEFSVPADTCPQPSQAMSGQIASQRVQLETLQQDIEALDTQLSGMSPSDPAYAQRVAEYNALVVELRALAEAHNASVASYNESVREHRACVEAIL